MAKSRTAYFPGRTQSDGSLFFAGDFILHLAGIDDKRVYLEHALEEAERQYQTNPIESEDLRISALDQGARSSLRGLVAHNLGLYQSDWPRFTPGQLFLRTWSIFEQV